MAKELELLSKLGILLIGISALVFAGVAIYWTWKGSIYEYRDPFWAYCSDNYIIIEANTNLYGVKVIDLEENRTICKFEKIAKYSSDACKVKIPENKTRLFKVVVGEYSKIVRCWSEKYIEGTKVLD